MKGLVPALCATLPVLLAPGAASAQSNLVVRSNSDCPDGQAVREALRAIRPEQEWPALTATIRVVDDRVQVSLGEDESRWREVPAPPGCADRASRVAVVIAVWSGELPAQITGAPRLSVALPAPVRAPGAPAKRSAMVTEVGLAGFYSMVGGMVPGGQIELGYLRRDGWWGLRAGAAYQSSKSRRVDIGLSQYRRALLDLALELRWQRPRLFLSSAWGIAGSLISAYGDGYSENQSTSGLNVGLAVDGRVGLRLGRFRVWADAGLYRWARPETIRVESLAGGPATTSRLPAWDAHLGVGAGLAFE